MSSTASPAPRPSAALPVQTDAVPTTGGRHRAPEVPGAVEYLTSEQIAAGPGRHAEPEYSRQVFDATRGDIDAFDWLGFEAAQD